MRTIARSLSVLTFFAIVVGSHAAPDLSFRTLVERYTIRDDHTVLYETGFLLGNGQLKSLTSYVEPPLFVTDDVLAELQLLSGRCIISEQLFDAYKALGAIPRLVRSQSSYPFGLSFYVIVSTVGGPDPNPRPFFESEPQNEAVLVGDSIYLVGWAQPEDEVSYQWLKNGKPIRGETSFFLSIPANSIRDSGRYSLQASIGRSTSVSKTAVVTVVAPVVIHRDLRNATVKNGRSIIFRVSARGSPPFTYHWFHNDAPIPQATSSMLLIRNAGDAHAGTYSVTVKNPLSTVNSSKITLSIGH